MVMTGAAGSTAVALVATAADVLAGELAAVDSAAVARAGAALDASEESECDDDAGLVACETAPPAITAATPAPATAHTIRRLMIDHPRPSFRRRTCCGCFGRSVPWNPPRGAAYATMLRGVCMATTRKRDLSGR
jgi:hypothetical protein